MKNGLTIKILDLPPCRNARFSRNPYIGMSGEVVDFNGTTFNIFTGSAYLIGMNINTCRYKITN